jgi:hypothetical protein
MFWLNFTDFSHNFILVLNNLEPIVFLSLWKLLVNFKLKWVFENIFINIFLTVSLIVRFLAIDFLLKRFIASVYVLYCVVMGYYIAVISGLI